MRCWRRSRWVKTLFPDATLLTPPWSSLTMLSISELPLKSGVNCDFGIIRKLFTHLVLFKHWRCCILVQMTNIKPVAPDLVQLICEMDSVAFVDECSSWPRREKFLHMHHPFLTLQNGATHCNFIPYLSKEWKELKWLQRLSQVFSLPEISVLF